MTLKEKFKIINCIDCDMPYCEIKCTILAPRELEKLEQIADDYAIEFTQWLDLKWSNTLTKKELLEIYKKEVEL